MRSSDSNNYRFERKWIFNTNYLDLLSKSYKSNFNFKIQHPKRTVNSLYFDDYNQTSVKQNLDGITDKSKIRLRWYGKNSFLITNAKLELKIKKNFLNYKVIYPMKDLKNKNIKNKKDVEFITKKINQTVKKKMLIPTVTTHYDRFYLISLNNKIRATIDYNLKGTNFNCYFQNPIFKVSGDVIVEFKYKKEYDNYVRSNLKKISSRFSKNSKYVNFALS